MQTTEVKPTGEVQPINEGKTKRILSIPGSPARVRIVSKDDITAGDGAKHDIIVGKAALATRTTCNVFRLLRDCDIPVAFEGQDGATEFLADKCAMLPYEVVIRREAHGSYLDRNPHLRKGHIFPRLILEFFLKTHGKTWEGVKSATTYQLVKDDPMIAFDHGSSSVELLYPGHTSEERRTAPKGMLVGQSPFLTLPWEEFFTYPNELDLIEQMGVIARKAFLVLERAWQIQGRRLVDFKVEFGLNTGGMLRLADVIDNDSWRVVDDSGGYIDKQVYRDGGDLNTVTAKYREVTEITGRFVVPRQQIIIWAGSANDDTELLEKWIKDLSGYAINVVKHTRSTHKQPELALLELRKRVQECPLSVIIADIGMSNGAGPTLSAHTTVPVITLPKNWKEFPEDVWSSLRTPSNVPVSTVLNPANAAMQALQILALNNPRLYMVLQFELEKRMINTMQI